MVPPSPQRVSSPQPARQTDQATEWWRGAVIYHIYPRSYADTSQDGVGDLPGITERLDYVADLGVDAIWLSPFFRSPMRDFGYDVSDYCDVDPLFGTLSDFDTLLDKAHKLGLKVVIDQVYSHTSDQHAWFEESRASRDNAKADWYVWADPKPDGTPPNNWQSVFTGPSWTWDSRRGQYYLHNFLSSQPDLNLHNGEVQDALLRVTDFWLERGVDGFRLDAINFAMHDPLLRDNPPVPVSHPKPGRPFDFQVHTYNQSHADIPAFLERIRAATDRYGAIFTVAEVAGPTPLEEMKAFTAGQTRLNSAYNFDFLYAPTLSAELVRSALTGWSDGSDEGWPAWAFSNHDAPRCVSRWAAPEDRAQAAKLHVALLGSLRGSVFLYQGEELGLPQVHIPFEALQDPEAIANWPLTLGRDGARTPMPWAAQAPYAGFSSVAPWLPMDPAHTALAVDTQEADPDSVLTFTRGMLNVRSDHTALRTGQIAFLEAPDGVLAFERAGDQETLMCVFNLTTENQSWSPNAPDALQSLIATGLATWPEPVPTTLPRLSGYIARRTR